MARSQKTAQPILAIVVPCFNEEEVLPTTIAKLLKVVDELKCQKSIHNDSFLFLVDDGCKDSTWQIITQTNRQNDRVKGLKLAKNVGHQNALLAGLLSVKDKADCVISIDADLQQDQKAIHQFVQKYLDGADIVYGIRSNRQTDSMIKKLTALFFYRFMKLMGTGVIRNHADYRLISKRALDTLAEYQETNLFLRGIVTDLGYETAIVYFDVTDRALGKSKYNMRKMISFALNGVTSFSVVPLRVVALIGFIIFLLSLIMGGYVLYESVVVNHTVPGWASTVLPIYFIGGVQLLSLGVVGEYIGKIYQEVKKRPRFIKDEEIW
ncbi:MAG: glycosyltransferase family 2 protein [Patescibacteria group bacterium]|jgi:glycosyltransferase involved in cell wall biosynthesis